MKRPLAALVLLATGALAIPARADAADGAGLASHQGQWSVRAGFVQGYEFHHRYEGSPHCRRRDFFWLTRITDPNVAPVEWKPTDCELAPPPALELAIGYAPVGWLEPFLFARLGLWEETTSYTSAGKLLGAGARIYPWGASRLRLFIEPAVGLAVEKHALDPIIFDASPGPHEVTPDSYRTDLVFHLGAGAQYDIGRHFGVFGGALADLGVRRARTIFLGLHTGIQARFP